MSQAKVLIEVTAGIIPQRAMDEYTKRWAITSEEWQAATDGAAQGFLLSSRNGQAQGYAAYMMMQPDTVNWVRTDWIWL